MLRYFLNLNFHGSVYLRSHPFRTFSSSALKTSASLATSEIDNGSNNPSSPTSFKINKNDYGMSLVSQDPFYDNKMISLAMSVPFGSKWEHYNEKGLSHILKAMSYKSNSLFSQMIITRTSEHLSIPLKVFLSREYMTYYAEAPFDQLKFVMQIFSSSLTNLSNYKPHEFTQALQSVLIESCGASGLPSYQLLERLHKVAFKNFDNSALGYPLLCPEWKVSNYGLDDIIHYKSRRMTDDSFQYKLIAIGHQIKEADITSLESDILIPSLRSAVKNAHSMMTSQSVHHHEKKKISSKKVGSAPSAVYVGGEEKIETHMDKYHLAMACPTIGYEDAKNYPTLLVLQSILLGGGEQQLVPYSQGSGLIHTSSNICGTTEVHPVSFSYSDTGLLGFYIVDKDYQSILQLGRSIATSVLQSGKEISKETLLKGKSIAKMTYANHQESRSSRIEDLNRQMSSTGKVFSIEEMLNAIDSVTLEDAQKMLKEILSQKPSIVVCGNSLDDYSLLESLSTTSSSTSSSHKKK